MRALPSLKGLGAIITAKCSNRGAIEAEISDTKEAFRPAYEKLLTSVARESNNVVVVKFVQRNAETKDVVSWRQATC